MTEYPKPELVENDERGMVTAEYAVGIIAAIALALVLLKIFTNADFIDQLGGIISTIIDKITGFLEFLQ